MGLAILLLLSAALIAALTPWHRDDERLAGASALLAAVLFAAIFAGVLG